MGNKGHEGVQEIKGKVQVIYKTHSHKEATTTRLQINCNMRPRIT